MKMEDSTKSLLRGFIRHPFTFLFMAIVVIPVYMFCFYEPDMSASDTTVRQVQI